MTKSPRKIANSAVAAIAAAAFCLGVPQQAMAQDGPTPATVVICFRGRTVTVPSYLLSRYVAAGAAPAACQTSP